jgi:signal transduction histidine kinase
MAVSAVVLGLVTVHVVDLGPGFALSQGTVAGRILLLSTTVALAVASIAARRRAVQLLLALLAVAWLAPDWNNPEAPEALFAIGLVTYASLPAVITHLAVDAHGGRAGWRWWVVGIGYAVCLGPRLVAAALLDPTSTGCQNCARNLLLLHDDLAAWTAVERWGLRMETVWLLGVLVLLVWWIVRRRNVVVVISGLVVAFALAGGVHSLGVGFFLNDPVAQLLWRGQGIALLLLAAVVLVDAAIVRRGRRSLTRVVGGLATPEDLRAGLARVLRDPGLCLAYPVEGGYADGVGARVEPAPRGRVATDIRRGDVHLATVGHRADLDPRRVSDYAESVSLGLENVRLRAVGLAQLDAIRRASARVVAASDAERRRLERDLHDGAQQSLVMLLLRLRLMPPGETSSTTEAHLEEAVERLRLIAHGLYPSMLDRTGLAASLDALTETRPLTIRFVSEERFERSVEATAYLLVERCSVAGAANLTIRRDGADLVIEVHADPADLTDVADRITALEGTLVQTGGFIRATLPADSRT